MGYRAREIRTCMMCTMSYGAYVVEHLTDQRRGYTHGAFCVWKTTRRVCSGNVRLYMHLQSKYRLCCTAWWHIYGVYYFHVPAKKGTSLSDYQQVGTTGPPTKTTSLRLADYR